MPPPADAPIGWSPNSAGSTAAQIASVVSAMTPAQAQAFLLSASSPVQFSRTMTFTEARSLNSSPIVLVDTTVILLPAGWYIQPIFWGVEQSMGAATYSAGPQMNLRYTGLAVDLCTAGINVSNAANRYLYTTGSIGNTNLGNGNASANRNLTVRSLADVANGSGSVRVFGAYVIMPEATV